jgi:hypothetical protein
MRVFARRSPLFSEVERVAVAFKKESSRARLLEASGGLGLLVVVGLSHEPTAPAERGKLLGLVEFASAAVPLSDLLDVDGERPQVGGFAALGFYALPVLRAWSFKPPLMRASDAFQDPLSIDPSERIIELSQREAELIAMLPKAEVRAPYEALRRQVFVLAKSLSAAPTTGPKPTAWTAEAGYDPNAEGWTYLMRFGGRDVWKVGHTQDIDRRLGELNMHVPHEALGEQWRLVHIHRWANSILAYEMEQRLLSALLPFRTVGERIACSEEVVRTIWTSVSGMQIEARTSLRFSFLD